MYANTGKHIEINLTTGDVAIESLPESVYQKYIGGSGLAAKLFFEKGSFDAEPLSKEALLIFMNGPFAGLKLSGASRNCLAGRSPLTRCWAESSCGGHFAPELRYAGFDGIVLAGKAPSPVILVIEDDTIRIVDACAYWGKETSAVNRDLKERYGKKSRTLTIGPAGENLVNYAIVLHDGHHAFGRAGFGAVMGSKNLKGIVVKASRKTMTYFDPDNYESLRKVLNARIKDHLLSVVMREDGTACNLTAGMYAGDVPIKNWTSNFWEEMGDRLNGDKLTENFLSNRRACAYCNVACKRVVEIKDGPFAITKGAGPEYETIAAFGGLIGSMDLAAACKAGRVCNDLGMDTISAGGSIAWAMEAFEKGDLGREDLDGVALNWGDLPTVIDSVLPAIAYCKGNLGTLLSRGSVAAASKVGKGSADYTVHCKGMEAPMHDPRGGGHGLALAYAMSPRGACHVAFPMLFMEAGACYYPEIGFDFELQPLTDADKPEAAMIGVDLGSIENSACFCQFADRSLTVQDWVALFNTVAGYGWDAKAMMQAGRRVFYIKRLINHRFGFTAENDTLSPRMLEPARDGTPKGVEINFEGMKKNFYELMELDAISGIPCREVLERYDMVGEAKRMRFSE